MSIRVMVIGCGPVAQKYHFKAWRKMDEVRLTAVCDLDEKVAKKTARIWNIPNYYTDVDDMLRQHSPSIVDICTPPQTHRILAVQALKSYCHVLLEKPMAMTSKEAEEIMSNYIRSGTKLGVIHNWLFEPVMIKALSLIRKGKLGQIINAEVRALSTNKDRMLSNKNHWCHSDPGGRLGEMLVHPIYVLQALLGQLDVKSVLTRKISDYPWVSADELFAVFSSNDAFGNIYASFNSSRDAAYIDVHGTQGSLSLELFNHTLIKQNYRPKNKRIKIAIDNLQQAYQLGRSTVQAAVGAFTRKRKNAHETCIRLFLKSVLNNEKPPVTPEEAYNSVRKLEELCSIIDSRHKNAY